MEFDARIGCPCIKTQAAASSLGQELVAAHCVLKFRNADIGCLVKYGWEWFMHSQHFSGSRFQKMFQSNNRTRGFTLVELLVVIAIIGVLVALLLPAIQAAREAARRSDCLNRIRQIALASHNYESAKKRIPPHVELPKAPGTYTNGIGVQAQLLPFMEQQNMVSLVDYTNHWRDGAQNAIAIRTPLPFLRCPSASSSEWNNMVLNVAGSSPEENQLRCHYVGNMGARPGPNEDGTNGLGCPTAGGSRGGGGAWGYPESSYTQRVCILRGGGSGGTSINGVIFPASDIHFGHVSDGTSNTIMFGEMSWDVGPQAAWLIGSGSKDGTSREAQISSAHGVVFNAKNIRYAPNSGKTSEPDGTMLAGKTEDNGTSNTPTGYTSSTDESLGSNHPGGCHVVMTDASGRFISDDIDVVAVLRPMASRNSGDVYQAPQ
jgi:prepilin-type N-terminal cleavage/methylation domain-containing protein